MSPRTVQTLIGAFSTAVLSYILFTIPSESIKLNFDVNNIFHLINAPSSVRRLLFKPLIMITCL